MPFIPLDQPRRRHEGFPRVSAAEQAARDAEAERIVRAEMDTFDTDNPEAQAALEAEYAQRFGKPAPVRRGFIPLANAEDARPARGFVPLEAAEPEAPSVMPSGKTILLNNPLTAVGETAANLGSQMIALPVAGLAGLATEAGRAIGFTDRSGADVVHVLGDALTYQPRGQLGQHLTEAAMYPFEKLAEAGQWAGGHTLETTSSPVAATAVDTAVNALPMLVAPAVKGVKATREKFSKRSQAHAEAEVEAARTASPAEAAEAGGQPKAAPRGQGDGEGHAAAGHGFTPAEAVVDTSPAAIPGRHAGEMSRGIPEPARAAEGGATADLASPEPRGFVTLVQAAAEAAVADIRLRAQKALEPPFAGERHVTQKTPSDRISNLDEHQVPLLQPEHQGVEVVRGAGSNNVPALGEEFPRIFRGRGAEAEFAALAGEEGRAAGLRAGERGMGAAENPAPAGTQLPLDRGERGAADGIRRGAEGRVAEKHSLLPADDLQGRPLPSADAGAPAEARGARWALVEADDLKASHDTEMRPRSENPFGRQGASRHEAEMAVQGITRKLNPERLAEALDDAHGAPIVARDGVVEAGQRRAIALQRIYQANGQKAENYRQFLRDNAVDFGLAPEQIAGMRKPVLVRLPDEPAPRRAAGADFSAEAAPEVQAMAAGTQSGTWNPGANYVPFVDQTRAPLSKATSTADLPAPIRREHIVKEFAEAVGTSIYEGRVKGKKRLGFFKPKTEEVRIKRANDLEVAAHEVAHLIDARVPGLSRAWRHDTALREELKSVSYDQKSVKEGFAESVRLFLTQPETLEARAPKVYAWLEGFTASDRKYGPALRKAQDRMTAWFGQDAINRARSKIGAEKPLAEYFDRAFDRLRQSTVDDLHGIYQMERDLTGKINPLGPYESARLSRASASIADGAARYGYPVKNPDGSFKFAGKGFEEILKPVAENLDDALLYFVGRSARELFGQGREHLFTQGEIDAMLRLRTPEREKAFADYQKWNRGILDFAEAQGVINPETRRLWKRTQYLPFHRVEQPGGVKGKPGDWQGIQALTGGTENLRDVMGNIIGNAAMLIDKAVKNEARLKIADLADSTKAGKWMVKIDTEARPVRISGDQVIEAMLKRYGIALDGPAPAFFEFMVKGQPPAGNNVVAVLRHGKPEWYEVADPILYRALTAIDRPVQHWLVKWLGLPKRVGQTTITATFDFWTANIARDTLMGGVMSRAGFRPILDSLDGMRMRITRDPIYKDWIANGGGLSSIYLDEARFKAKLEKFYGRQGIDYRTVLDTPDKLMSAIETIGDAFEASTRLGEFKRALARGENSRHAAYLAREVSTDFAMKGDSKALGFMYDTVMFLRPAVVSIDRLARGVAHDPNKGAIATKTAAIALASVVLYLQNRNDPRYADLPDWDRDTHWHFFVGDLHFRYPKIWEIGALASSAERSVEKLLAEDPEGLGKDFARIVGQTFNLNLMPQVIAPLYEQATNRNSFTKAPIETPGMENVQPFLRAKPGTSETMKALGMTTRDLPEGVQINPTRAEALLRGYLNTWGMYGLMLTDQAFFGDQLPEKRVDELPVVRRFYSQEPAKHTKFESQFYEMLSEAKRLRGTLKELDEMNLRSLADEKEKSPMTGEAKPLERAAKNLVAINNEMQSVRRDANLTQAEKRQRLDALTVERNALLKEAVLESKKAQAEREKEVVQ